MLRGCYVIGGIVVAMMVVGCEKGSGSGGGNPVADNSASSSNNPPKNTDPEVFLPSPMLAAPPNDDVVGELYMTGIPANNGGGPAAPSIEVAQVTVVSGGASYGTAALVTGNPPSASTAANAIAAPEPFTASLCLMSLGALGMATRRRVV